MLVLVPLSLPFSLQCAIVNIYKNEVDWLFGPLLSKVHTFLSILRLLHSHTNSLLQPNFEKKWVSCFWIDVLQLNNTCLSRQSMWAIQGGNTFNFSDQGNKSDDMALILHCVILWAKNWIYYELMFLELESFNLQWFLYLRKLVSKTSWTVGYCKSTMSHSDQKRFENQMTDLKALIYP